VDQNDVWKLVLGGVVTVLGGLLLHQVQLGGRKRRRRRDIREQLELLVLLDAHPDVKARIERRVKAALDRYEPSPETRRAAWERRTGPISLASAITVATATIVLTDISTSDPMLLVAIAITAAGGALGMEELLTRRLQEHAEDAAVARGTARGTFGFEGTARGMAPPVASESAATRPPATEAD
jgi:hypothetical protein